jgi:hypothetical protein
MWDHGRDLSRRDSHTGKVAYAVAVRILERVNGETPRKTWCRGFASNPSTAHLASAASVAGLVVLASKVKLLDELALGRTLGQSSNGLFVHLFI